MAIEIGHPVSFTEIASIVAANYPEYTVQSSPVGTPLSLFGFVTGAYSPPLYSGVFTAFQHICLAMISPMSIRPFSIGSFDLFDEGMVSFAPSSLTVGTPFVAPNFWQEFDGTEFGDQGSAVDDVDALLTSYLASNPTFKCLGCLRSTYRFDDGVDLHFFSVIRASFRQP